MQSSLLTTYKKIHPALRYEADELGNLSILQPTGTLLPAKVEGQRLALPTNKALRDGEEGITFWHPLSESLARRGTSPVLQHMQRFARANIAYAVEYITTELLKIAVDQSTHKDLPPDASDFLRKLTGVGKNTVALYDKIIAAAIKNHRLVVVYLKADGKYEGKKVTRMTVIRFPILEDLLDESGKVYGIPVPKKERQVLRALFQLVVPGGDDPEEYSAGTTTRVAPYFTSFLKAYAKVTKQLNKSIALYGEALHFTLKPFPTYPDNIYDTFEDVYNEIPALSGNEGGRQTEEEAAAEAEAVPTMLAAPKGTAMKSTAMFQQETEPKRTVAHPTRNAVVQPAATAPGTVSIEDALAGLRQAQNPGYNPNMGMQPTLFAQPQQPQFFQPMQPAVPQQPQFVQPSWFQQPQQMPQQPMNPYAGVTSGGVSMPQSTFPFVTTPTSYL